MDDCSGQRWRYILPALLLISLSSMSIRASAQEQNSPTIPAPELAEEEIPTVSVVVDGRPLFSVRGFSAYSAKQRAQDITARIIELAANHSFSPTSLQLVEASGGTQILADNLRIMTVLDADARLEKVNRGLLAQVLSTQIAEALKEYRQNREPAFLVRHGLYAFAATLALLLWLVIGRRTVRLIRSSLEQRYKHKIHGLGIQSLHLIEAEQLWRILTGVVNLLWVIVIVATAYLYLHFVLSLFPWTRGFANNLLAVLADPLKTIGRGFLLQIPDLVFLAILTLLTRYVLMLIRLFFSAVENRTIELKDFDPEWGWPTYRLVRIVVIACALVVAYPYIPGSNSQAFKGVSLFIGVLFSLGSTSLIGNMIAGYTMTYRRMFKTGDRVKIGNHIGDVEQSRLLVTYLRTPKNEIVAVPNSAIINEEVVNYSTLADKQGLILHSTVGVGYEAPWRQVEAMLLEAAARTPGLLRDPEPFVLQQSLGDFAVSYEVNGYCDQPRAMFRLYTLLHQNILDLFNEYGVQIMTPAYESDPDDKKVVPKAQWYAPPAHPPESSGRSDLPYTKRSEPMNAGQDTR